MRLFRSVAEWITETWNGFRWARRRRRSRHGKRPCDCCGYLTLELDPGDYEICPVCFWEDDPVQANDHDYKPGANKVSLNEARANYRALGVSEPEYKDDVRPPLAEEVPPAR
jgi:Cysteine-rich CPCC